MATFLITVFIIIYIYFAWSWPAPERSLWKRSINWSSRYVRWLGLQHNWGMFGNPIRSLNYLEAEITFSNGNTLIWKATRIDLLSIPEAFLAIRHRKYQHNLFGAPLVAKSAFARYLWQNHYCHNNPPVKINLFIQECKVPPADRPYAQWPKAQRFLIYSWNNTLEPL